MSALYYNITEVTIEQRFIETQSDWDLMAKSKHEDDSIEIGLSYGDDSCLELIVMDAGRLSRLRS